MKRIRFAIVGYGHIGKRHAEMIQRQDHAELVALCDIHGIQDPSFPHLNLFTDYSTFLESLDKKADVICICTPNGLHAAMANAAIKAGFHVLIEKPMGLSKKNCEEVIFNALRYQKQVFCVMQNRYSPPSQWIKSLLQEGRLGQIYMVQLTCLWNRDDRYYLPKGWHGTKDLDGGTLFTQFSHFIDMLYWLFGDLDEISGRVYNYKHLHSTDFEDSGVLRFTFENGIAGSFCFSTAVYDKNQESSLSIVAENGSVKLGGQYMNEVEYCHVKDYNIPILEASNPANDYGTYKGSAANHAYVIQNVIEVLNGKGQSTTNALEGLKVVDIIERMYNSVDKYKA